MENELALTDFDESAPNLDASYSSLLEEEPDQDNYMKMLLMHEEGIDESWI